MAPDKTKTPCIGCGRLDYLNDNYQCPVCVERLKAIEHLKNLRKVSIFDADFRRS